MLVTFQIDSVFDETVLARIPAVVNRLTEGLSYPSERSVSEIPNKSGLRIW